MRIVYIKKNKIYPQLYMCDNLFKLNLYKGRLNSKYFILENKNSNYIKIN